MPGPAWCVALDDTKVAANAADRVNRTHATLEAEVVAIRGRRPRPISERTASTARPVGRTPSRAREPRRTAGPAADIAKLSAGREDSTRELGTDRERYFPARASPQATGTAPGHRVHQAGLLPADRLVSEAITLDERNPGFDRLAGGEAVRQRVGADAC
jgi:hypothetical protein